MKRAGVGNSPARFEPYLAQQQTALSRYGMHRLMST
jgi:hypothetical protein